VIQTCIAIVTGTISQFSVHVLFRVPFSTLPFGLGIVVEHSWFISCYYFIQKIWLNFESSQQILTNFQPVRFLLHRRFSVQNVSMCRWSARILWDAFLIKPVSSAVILTLNRWSFAITAHTTSTFWSFVAEIGLPERGSSSTFSQPSLKALWEDWQTDWSHTMIDRRWHSSSYMLYMILLAADCDSDRYLVIVKVTERVNAIEGFCQNPCYTDSLVSGSVSSKRFCFSLTTFWDL
jgi:hypothetical protein